MDDKSGKDLFKLYALDSGGPQWTSMDMVVLHGMEEVRSSILLSSTETPGRRAAGKRRDQFFGARRVPHGIVFATEHTPLSTSTGQSTSARSAR
jgi:hypothetical protein